MPITNPEEALEGQITRSMDGQMFNAYSIWLKGDYAGAFNKASAAWYQWRDQMFTFYIWYNLSLSPSDIFEAWFREMLQRW